MKHAYKLSICMMVKNEENNLNRCLASLEILLKRSDVELIIVDTGSSDSTIEIASKYTSKVHHHLWNNNFSEMRNITISYAKGEWILILDADEEILDQAQLTGLLKDPRLNKFNTVQFSMHDYVKSTDDSNYLKYNSYRMFRNDGTFNYKGAVHNQPNMKGPILIAPVVLNHYGYQFDNKELLERKFQRTASILQSELEKEPNNIYYRYQLANSYYIHDDLMEALDEIRIAYANMKELTLEQRVKHPYVYAEYARESYANRQYNECIEICQEGIMLIPDYIDLHHYISLAYRVLNKPDKSIEHAHRHLELANSFDKLEITKEASVIMMCADLYSINSSYTILTSQYYELGEYRYALEFAMKMQDSEKKYEFLLLIYIQTNEFEAIYNNFLKLNDDNQVKGNYVRKLEQHRTTLSVQQKAEIERLFAQGDDDYAFLQKIRSGGNSELGEILTVEFIKSINFNEKELFYGDVFTHFERDRKEILSAFKKIKNNKLKQYIQYLTSHYSIVEHQLISYLVSENIRPNDYDANRVYACIANVLFLTEIEAAKNENRKVQTLYLDVFEKYVDRSICKLSQIFKLDKMRLYYSTLDDAEDQYFMLLHFAQEAIQKMNYQLAVKYIREAVETYPYLTLAMSNYQDKLFKFTMSN